MLEDIKNFPNQFKAGLKAARGIGAEGNFEKLVICGMGGSALPATLLLTYLPDLEIPLYIHRDYNLPPQANKKSLVVVVSFSGNTEETLSAFKEAEEKDLPLVAITSGGKLKEMGGPVVVLPDPSIQPRMAIGYLFSALLGILSNSGVIEDKKEEILGLELSPEEFEEEGKILAKKLKRKIPLVYASRRFEALARIWKIKFNENSKTPSFWNFFPELNHNEMTGFVNAKAGSFHGIILKDKDDDSRILKRMNLTAEILGEKGIEFDFIDIKGKNTLEKIFNSNILSEWTSFYLAKEYGVDPEPVEMVEDFKKEL